MFVFVFVCAHVYARACACSHVSIEAAIEVEEHPTQKSNTGGGWQAGGNPINYSRGSLDDSMMKIAYPSLMH